MRKRKVPVRRDLLTNTIQPRKDLVRIVINEEKEASAGPTGKKSGHGTYVSPEPGKMAGAQKNKILDRSLGTKIDSSFHKELLEYVGHQKARKELFGDK